MLMQLDILFPNLVSFFLFLLLASLPLMNRFVFFIMQKKSSISFLSSSINKKVVLIEEKRMEAINCCRWYDLLKICASCFPLIQIKSVRFTLISLLNLIFNDRHLTQSIQWKDFLVSCAQRRTDAFFFLMDLHGILCRKCRLMSSVFL